MCGRNIPPAWYDNSQLRGLYQPLCFLFFSPPKFLSSVAFPPSGEPTASHDFYLLDNPSHVKNDNADMLQSAGAFTHRGEGFVKHPSKFELSMTLYMPEELAHWTAAKTLKRIQAR